MAALVNGAHLPRALQEEAKRRFLGRYTGEHMPNWAKRPMSNGKAYPVQFADDADWLANTEFFVVKDRSRLAYKPGHCVSHPTWPNNPEMRKAD